MLSAEHLALQSRLVQQLVAVRQKEMDYMLMRYQAIGTQAALLCGFSISSLTSLDPSDTEHVTKGVAHMFYISSFICVLTNLHVILTTLFVCNWAPGLALRGPTGSMSRAFDATRGERTQVNISFVVGVLAFGMQTTLCVWILDNKAAATADSIIASCLMGVAAMASLLYLMRCALAPSSHGMPAQAHTFASHDTQDARALLRPEDLQELPLHRPLPLPLPRGPHRRATRGHGRRYQRVHAPVPRNGRVGRVTRRCPPGRSTKQVVLQARQPRLAGGRDLGCEWRWTHARRWSDAAS